MAVLEVAFFNTRSKVSVFKALQGFVDAAVTKQHMSRSNRVEPQCMFS